MNTFCRIIFLFEIMVLFGPATLIVFMSPIGLLASIGQYSEYWATLWVVTLGAGGIFGLFAIFNLTAFTLDKDHRLPKKHWLFLGIATGATACVVMMETAQFEPYIVIALGAPVLGAIHLLWLNRRVLKNAA